jgi:methylglutamate dehydrogenase subunit B
VIITCPYCGPRDQVEFAYQGDANRLRPHPASTDQTAWNAYVYARANPLGDHREIWQHSGGCRMHIAIVRNTLTHVILDAKPVRPGGGPVENTPSAAGEAS